MHKLFNYFCCEVFSMTKRKRTTYFERLRFFLRSIQEGEITVYGLTETAWQVSSVGLHVEKHRHDYRLKHPQGRQDQKKKKTT